MTEKEQLQQQIENLEKQIYFAKIDLYMLKTQYLEKFPEDTPVTIILLDPPKKKRGRPKKMTEHIEVHEEYDEYKKDLTLEFPPYEESKTDKGDVDGSI